MSHTTTTTIRPATFPQGRAWSADRWCPRRLQHLVHAVQAAGFAAGAQLDVLVETSRSTGFTIVGQLVDVRPRQFGGYGLAVRHPHGSVTVYGLDELGAITPLPAPGTPRIAHDAIADVMAEERVATQAVLEAMNAAGGMGHVGALKVEGVSLGGYTASVTEYRSGTNEALSYWGVDLAAGTASCSYVASARAALVTA